MVRLVCMLVAWVGVESSGPPMGDQSRDLEVEHAAAMESLGMARLHVFAWGMLQKASEVKT